MSNNSNETDDYELPELALSEDQSSISATVPGDSRSFVRAEKTHESGIVEVTDIFRGEKIPKGAGGQFLAETLLGHGTLPTKQLIFKHIINKPVVDLYNAGGNPEKSILGDTAKRALQHLNLEPSDFRFEVSRGKLNLVVDVK